MSGSDVTRRAFAAGALAACATVARSVEAGPALVEGPLAGGGFFGHRVYPAGGLGRTPVLVFAPLVRGRAAPLHREFAQRLARRGFYVITPELADGRPGLFEAVKRAAAEGADVRRRAVLGYDGGAAAAHDALARDPGLKAGLVVQGPLTFNPIAGAFALGRLAEHPRMLTLDARQGLMDARSAEHLIDAVVQWLVQRGLHP